MRFVSIIQIKTHKFFKTLICYSISRKAETKKNKICNIQFLISNHFILLLNDDTWKVSLTKFKLNINYINNFSVCEVCP